MGFFNWAAPMFGRYADRWTAADIDEIAGWLRPFVSADGSVLDVGGGTGALADKLQRALHAEVTVLDPTPQMVRYLPEGSEVKVVLGHAEAMPFAEATFDAVVVTDAFHHFRDRRLASTEFARVVRPGGGVLILELDPTGFAMRVIALGERVLGEPAAFLEPERMTAVMQAAGIEGESTRLGNGPSYRFLGRVAGPTL